MTRHSVENIHLHQHPWKYKLKIKSAKLKKYEHITDRRKPKTYIVCGDCGHTMESKRKKSCPMCDSKKLQRPQ